ncbi:MFS general substrate transporter [Cucurbitaria berberidis CBS 394.84]|uniref:MFS general substrate transporter n=1 Tax=Cucurbitaria berberidis CBS 394.84 TaxID=1168544 RepID=A0A9P4LFG5_9PLEO|nr:MFS general substrate transporter [Cucurbitaria berberidis CBS 394.84]KAF1852049.1 MFS general substrate transporter [Cucurbitaria berberidis CBS 394.84]
MENLENGKQEAWTSADLPPTKNRDDEPGTHSQIENHDSASRPGKPLAFHMSFIALLIMGFICALDATVLGVAIPSIVYELDGTTLEGFWASISFLLAVVIVQPLYTNISNVMGRMMPLYTSYFFFIAGSIVFALSRNMTTLIAGRVLEGLGAGGLDVLNEIILADITTLKERPMYLGYFAIPMLGGTVLGPILGGVFSQYVTWRWIGWINLPLSAIGLVLSIFFLKLKAIDQPMREKMRRLDWGGIVLFTTGCTLFASPVAWAGAMFPWSSYKTLVPLILGAVLLVAFAFYERRPIEPVFPYRMFSDRTAALTLFASFLHGIGNYSITLYIPLFFQAIYLEEPLAAAVLTLPVCFLAIATAVLAAVAVEVLRKYRLVILVSWIFMAVGAGILTLLGPSSTLAEKESFQVVLGIGIGAFWSVLNLPLQASMQNADDMGLAAGILCSFRLFGGLIGLSMSSTIFNTIFINKIKALGPLPGELAALSDIREAVGFVPLLRNIEKSVEVLDSVIDAYRISIFGVFWMIAGTSGVGFFISWFIEDKPLEGEELGKQHFETKKQESIP